MGTSLGAGLASELSVQHLVSAAAQGLFTASAQVHLLQSLAMPHCKEVELEEWSPACLFRSIGSLELANAMFGKRWHYTCPLRYCPQTWMHVLDLLRV